MGWALGATWAPSGPRPISAHQLRMSVIWASQLPSVSCRSPSSCCLLCCSRSSSSSSWGPGGRRGQSPGAPAPGTLPVSTLARPLQLACLLRALQSQGDSQPRGLAVLPGRPAVPPALSHCLAICPALLSALLTRSCSRLSRRFSSWSRHRASSFPLSLGRRGWLSDSWLGPSPCPPPELPSSPVATGLLQLYTQGSHLLPQLGFLRPTLRQSCTIGLRGRVDGLGDMERGHAGVRKAMARPTPGTQAWT